MQGKMSKNKIKEFDFISRYLVPLTRGHKGALQLKDDVAIIPKDSKTDYIITLDTLVEDVHFVASATPEQIANKLLRANLSDIASCGGVPKFYFMTGSLMNEAWIKKFTGEISKIQKQYEIILLGGDTVRSGQKFFSVTMVGEVTKGKAMLRSGAKVGDDIYVSGKIGEAWVGLQILQKKLNIKTNKQHYITKHYSPSPQVELGKKLVGIANSCTDISDGLLKDLNNILKTSNVSAVLEAKKIPLAIADTKYFEQQITAGDDYQLVFTAPKSARAKIESLKFPIARIGKVVANNKKEAIIISGFPNKIKRLGYEH